jgi:hypothetical protein
MSMLTHHRPIGGLIMAVLMIAAVLAGCENMETGKAQLEPSPSPLQLPLIHQTVQPTPTPFVLADVLGLDLDLMAGPIDVPLELQIPSLKVKAPVLGVGLTAEKKMDAPRGPIGDPMWHKAYWYRGSGIPGEPGTATFAGHINDPLGRQEIFAHIQDLQPGDPIIVHVKDTAIDIRFTVDQVVVYSLQESSNRAVLGWVFGFGRTDGLSHLTLITCTGYIVNGVFDHYVVVFATLSHVE